MIGLDTNILLRLWLDDDPAQGRRIDALLSEHGRGIGSLLISDVVLVEAVWTLSTSYAQGKSEQVQALRSLLDEPAFSFENRDAFTVALAAFEQATCGFSDCLIAAKHAAMGCAFTATFDKRMRKLDGVRVI